MLTLAHPFLTRWTQVSLALLGILAGTGGCTEEVLGNSIAPQPRIDLLVLCWAMMIYRESDKPSAVLNGEPVIRFSFTFECFAIRLSRCLQQKSF